MKKLISVALCLVMALSLFVGCNNEEPAGNSDLKNAKDYLVNMYQTAGKGEVMELLMDKDVLSVVTIDGVSYDVAWSITVTQGASDAVTIGESDEKNHVKIMVPDLPEEDILFTATATIKDKDGNTEAANFSYKVTGLPAVGLSTEEILNQAYALEEGASMAEPATLIGKITKINTPYDTGYKNITVTITMEGFEDKPIKCYRLAGDGAEGLAVGDTITVTGTLTNYQGTIEFGQGCELISVVKAEGTTDPTPDNTQNSTAGSAPSATPSATPSTKPSTTPGATSGTVPTTQTGIVDAAYALEEGKSLSYEATLTGKVISVNEDYDSQFKNITVTIQVSGREDKPIKCYRMTGDGVDKVVKGDTITVRGTLKNYNGTIEFDLGCTMTKRVSSGNAPVTQLTSPAQIMAAAYALSPGEDLGYDVTLTGKVTGIKTAYDASFDNVSVIIVVENKDLLCYRMKGEGIDKIVAGDTITVTGRIINYNGTIEFEAGCTMRKRVSGGVVVPTDPIEIVNAAYALEPGKALPYTATLTGKIISIDTEYSAQYKNITVTIEIAGCEDKPIKCYRLKGDGADALKVGDTITVTGVIKNYQHSSGDCEVEFDSGCTFVK